jgi:hypothetical protein
MNKWLYIRIALLLASGLLSLWNGPLSSHAEPPLDAKSLLLIFGFGIIGIQFLLSVQFINKFSSDVLLSHHG